MAENTISLQEEEMQELAVLVAEALQGGESREQVVADLAKNGLGDLEAEEFVTSVEYQLYQVHTPVSKVDDGNSGMGWLVWVAVGVGVKVLSWLFE